jgi:transcription elongation factor GreA
MSRVLLTHRGAERLREELKRLKGVERPRVIQAIAEARAHGDLSENAEYEAAKHQQSLLEGRIADLEAKLSRAEVINPSTLNASGKVVFGASVDLYDDESGNEVSYQVVGDLEANPDQGQISLSSPIGKALIGRSEGEEVLVVTPGGTRRYEVVKVRYE